MTLWLVLEGSVVDLGKVWKVLTSVPFQDILCHCRWQRHIKTVNRVTYRIDSLSRWLCWQFRVISCFDSQINIIELRRVSHLLVHQAYRIILTTFLRHWQSILIELSQAFFDLSSWLFSVMVVIKWCIPVDFECAASRTQSDIKLGFSKRMLFLLAY